MDTDGDGILDPDEDINGNGNLDDDDSDSDGIPDYLDPYDDSRLTAYLPQVFAQTYPDLIVDSIVISADRIVVTVRNIGQAPAVDAFWVDLYIAPVPPPVGVNQLWYDLGTQGIAWGVTASALPLAPGEHLVLTSQDGYLDADRTFFVLPIAPETPLYAGVDVWNPDTAYGTVLETHEAQGGVYNNLLGPVSATHRTEPLSIAAPSVESSPSTGRPLPPRPLPPQRAGP